MGSGEPLDNYDNLIRFLKLINSEYGLHISARNITVSTCGLVPEIYQLAKRTITDNISNFATCPNDCLRRTMIPIANKYSVKEIIKSMSLLY